MSESKSKQQNLFEVDPDPWLLDEEQEGAVAQVVFPEGPQDRFDYLVPDQLRDQLRPGCRVKVPLGRGNRTVLAYCVGILNEAQREGEQRRFALKHLKSIIDREPLLSETMLKLTEWMADYYLCSWGQAIEAAVPVGVREQAGTRQMIYLSVPAHVGARITQLKLPPKQAQALSYLLACPQPQTPREIAAAVNCTQAPISALRKKGLVKEEVRRVSTEPERSAKGPRESNLPLNDAQQAALQAIITALQEQRHETLLMNGVTGSGKTEVYIRAIDEVIHFGRQAIVLVPEISLTPQTCERFRSRFDSVAVLHSHLSSAERNWHWRRIAKGEVQVVVGARSAVFAPTPQLGMIVIDEEHDSSFKQDQAPRYHARSIAQYRARAEGAPLVLGSATPSLESWARAEAGQFRLLEMPHRVLDRPLPDVAVIDLRTEYKNRMSRGAISRQLRQAMQQALNENGKIILLLNRRGYSTHIQCPSCGLVVKCPDCDIALTHHRQGDRVICHYCDFERPAPPVCPECRFEGIRYSGFGTQKLEDEVRARFPEAVCLRMDSDTMQKPGSHEQALTRFREGDVQILLGTQMIAKGLDFPDVTLVGVINADTALHFPDFRAAERTFQLVTQVAGRTGRSSRGGRVLVQSFSPEHPAIQAAMRHDFDAFARQELPNRREFGYPPATALLRLIIRGENEIITEQFAEHFAELVRGALPVESEIRVMGPAPAPIAKLRGKFRFHILLLGADRSAMRQTVRTVSAELKPPDAVQWAADVDPVDLL